MNNALESEAKKHKKLFETYRIHNKYVRVNGKDFYLVFYEKFNKHSGFALITQSSDATDKEYLEAFERSVILNNNLASFINNAMERAKINMEPYVTTKSFLENLLGNFEIEERARNIYEETIHNISSIINLQNQLIEIANSMKNLVQSKNCFMDEDIDAVKRALAEFDYIQYNQGRLSYKSIDHYEFIISHIYNNVEINSITPKKVQVYLKELSKGKEKLKEQLKAITHVEGLEHMSKEEHLKAVIEKYISDQTKANAALIKEMRYPILN